MKLFVTPGCGARSEGAGVKYKWMHLGALAAGAPQRVFAQNGDTMDTSAWLLGPLGIAVLLGACAWAVLHVLRQRRRGGGAGPDLPVVLGATALGARERAVVLKANGRVFLVGVTAHHISLLAELDAQTPSSQVADLKALL